MSMVKSELIQRIAAQNPHLYQRDIEKVVDTILHEMVDALRRGDRVECGVSEPFQLGSEHHVKGAILVLVLPSQSQRKPFFKTGKDMRARLNRETLPSD